MSRSAAFVARGDDDGVNRGSLAVDFGRLSSTYPTLRRRARHRPSLGGAGPLRAHRSAATRPSGHRKRTSALRSSHLRAAPMAFEMDRIAREWLGGSRLAIAPSEVVAGFNKAEELLGAEWIQAYKGGAGQDLAGAGVALPIAVVGLQLRSVQGAPGLNEVLSRLKARDRAARSELAAASYCVEDRLMCVSSSAPTSALARATVGRISALRSLATPGRMSKSRHPIGPKRTGARRE